jgi:hypothetical protein
MMKYELNLSQLNKKDSLSIQVHRINQINKMIDSRTQ